VKITPERAVCLTEGFKLSKDVMFFLNADNDPVSHLKNGGPGKKGSKPQSKGSPAKHKVVGNKVLRSKARSSAQEEAINSAVTKLAEHQRDLHENRQREGLAKYSEEGRGGIGKEGKSWKRFQSYKSESVLPPEVHSLRVGSFIQPPFPN
jgi:nucleosome binding factor SPN SPT16 subunit